jgi:hypothetical protein
MASADTLCKKLLNVKNTVVESYNFYNDVDGVTHLRSRLVLLLGIRMTALSAGEDTSPDTTGRPRKIRSGVGWTFQESSLRSKRLPIESSARNMVLSPLLFHGRMPRAVSQRISL